MPTCREASKQNWTTNNTQATESEINLGSLQRIADATEVMAGNFIALQNDRDLYRRWYNEQRQNTEKLYNRIRSLKGHITRLKKNRK